MLELIYNGEVHYRRERNHPDINMWLNQMDVGQANAYFLRGSCNSHTIERNDFGKERQPCGGHNNESRAICHIDSDTCPAREKIVYCNLNGECKNKRAGVS